ncbi:hypothetical protein BpHYR1_035912, partial [Brachionus plicatilis]
KSDLRERLNEAIKNNEKLKNSYETELKKTVEDSESKKYKSEFEENMVILNSEFEIKNDNNIKMQSSSDSEILKLRKQISDLKSINKTLKQNFSSYKSIILKENNEKLKAKDERLKELEQKMQENKSMTSNFESDQKASFEKLRTSKDHEIKHKDDFLKDKEQQLKEYEFALDDRENQISDLKSVKKNSKTKFFVI